MSWAGRLAQHLVQRFLIAVAWSITWASAAMRGPGRRLNWACADLIDQDRLAIGQQRDSQLLLDPVDRHLDAQLDQER
ncbi:hypothetical protein [Pseudomonas aeruginosa]|uniref:hypothetical protein n=1 Tax=Pseudomonas aeruginosa TaxID=287 RepID=UPI0030F25D62